MTIKEMLAAGMSREDVAARLVKARLAPDTVNANFMIAFTLGEIDGDLLNDEPNERDAVFRRRLETIRERRLREAASVPGDD